jgi:hypothetical protein
MTTLTALSIASAAIILCWLIATTVCMLWLCYSAWRLGPEPSAKPELVLPQRQLIRVISNIDEEAML